MATEFTVSNQTREKVESAKTYIERRYTKLIQQEREKKQNWELLYKKMQNLHLTENEQENLKSNILHKEAEKLRLNRKKISINNYEPLKIIGKGAFGQVRLCRQIETSKPVAIKKMIKSEMVYKNKVFQAREEKDILANSQNNEWIVELKCSFQDQKNLYLVMQYISGGDLMNLLIKKDILTEEQARFYTAEILLALESVHKLHYIHRDLKPDNVLIDIDGHIKLSDFGLCKYTQIRSKKLNEITVKSPQEIQSKKKFDIKTISKQLKKNRKLAYSAVGTPDYVAPQVQNKTGYTETVDWWSLGVILYEMLVGYPPFVSQDSSITWHKIQNWRKYLVIPKEVPLSNAAVDLIKKLITDQKQRLGTNGVQEIKNHPFFAGVDWKNIRNQEAPNVPELNNDFDTQNFDVFEKGEQWINYEPKSGKKSRKDVMFIGYTFKKSDSEKSQLLKALLDLDHMQPLTLHSSPQLEMANNTIESSEEQKNRFLKKEKLQQSLKAQGLKKDLSMNQLFSSTSTNTTHKNSLKVQIEKKPETPKYISPKNFNFKSKEPIIKQTPVNPIVSIKEESSKKNLLIMKPQPPPLLRNAQSPNLKKK